MLCRAQPFGQLTDEQVIENAGEFFRDQGRQVRAEGREDGSEGLGQPVIIGTKDHFAFHPCCHNAGVPVPAPACPLSLYDLMLRLLGRAQAATTVFPGAWVTARRCGQHSVTHNTQPPSSGGGEALAPGKASRHPTPFPSRPPLPPLRGSGRSGLALPGEADALPSPDMLSCLLPAPLLEAPAAHPAGPVDGILSDTQQAIPWGRLGEDIGQTWTWPTGTPGPHWTTLVPGEKAAAPTASLSPSHTGPHWLRIWEVRRTRKEKGFPCISSSIALSFGLSLLHSLKHWTWGDLPPTLPLPTLPPAVL